MSQSAVYLCPSCQEVIRSEGRNPDELVCHSCGFELGKKASQNPSLQKSISTTNLPGNKAATSGIVRNVVRGGGARVKAALPVKETAPAIKASLPEIKPSENPELKEEEGTKDENEEIILADGSRQVRRRKKRRKERNKTLYLFLGGWLLVVVVIVSFFMAPSLNNEEPPALSDDEDEELARKKMHSRFLIKHRAAALNAFQNFLTQEVKQGRLQTIDYSSNLATNYGRFYEFEAPLQPTPGLTLVDVRVREFAEGKVTPGIESIWQTREGNQIEVLSVWDGRSWKVDWEMMERYSSEAWALFRLGVSERKTGTFRLFARKKNLPSSKDLEVVFHSPARPGNPERGDILDRASEGVPLEHNSEIGLLFKRLWSDYEAEEHTFDSIFPEGDPRNMMRITVRLGWEEDEKGEKKMKLLEIIQPAWYGKRVQEIFKKHPPVISIISDRNGILNRLGE